MRVSATDLDAFRYWRDSEDASLEALVAQLRRELAPTEPMLAGTAFHKALELAPYEELATLQADGYTFDLELDAEIDLPVIRELKATRELVIDGEPVTLVCVADTVDGRKISDHKLTSRFDADRYLAGYQWRVNLLVFDAQEFRWNAFEARSDKPGHYIVHTLHTLTATRYPNLEADVRAELADFLAFARVQLPERFQKDAA